MFTLMIDARAPSNVYFKLQMFTLAPVTVDMRITRFGIWGPKSRSVNNSSQRSDFGLWGLILDKFSLVYSSLV